MTKKPDIRLDPTDGMPALGIGEWAKEKHRILTHYIEASTPARRKTHQFSSTYIDLYSGPGRVFIRETDTFMDGSPVLAARASLKCGMPFSHFVINDCNRDFVDSCSARLGALGVAHDSFVGEADQNVDEIISQIPRRGITIAFVDPFDLVPFVIIERLAFLPKMDVVLYVGIQELRRNVYKYLEKKNPKIEAFAPGVTERVKLTTQPRVFLEVFNYWKKLVESTGLKIGNRFEKFTGPTNATLYWLVIAAKHPLADNIFSSIVAAGKQRSLL